MINANFIDIGFFGRNISIQQYKNLFDSLSDSLSKIKEKIQDFTESIFHNRKDFENQKDDLINTVINGYLSIEDLLRQIPFFKDEYYDFTSIRFMSSYILLNELSDNYQLVIDMFDEFSILINSKIKMKPESYETIYDEFFFKLDEYEHRFYTEIYEKSDSFNEKVLAEISYTLLN